MYKLDIYQSYEEIFFKSFCSFISFAKIYDETFLKYQFIAEAALEVKESQYYSLVNVFHKVVDSVKNGIKHFSIELQISSV